MITNYADFKNFLEDIKKSCEKPKLLLHACCGPCATHVLEVLKDYFDITVFFDNSNIHPYSEYEKRYQELEKVVSHYNGVKLINFIYLQDTYYKAVSGYENDGEFSKRCELCMKLRLENTFNYALAFGFDYFTTTLSISPYKSSKVINEIGYNIMNSHKDKNVKFLYSDFKKENGYQESIRLSKEYGLYRQSYCGCSFSKKEALEKVL